MRASAIEFRFRVAIFVAIITLGFWSPWIELWNVGRRISLLEWSALELARLGLVSFAAATPIVIVLAAIVAAIAVVLRIWGTAYLGPAVVHNAQMRAGAVMADGPYRYVRNPLYLGLWCMIAAMSFIMPATGAVFTMVLATVFLLRLIRGEEAFLTAQLGEPYAAYLRAAPRLLPRFRTTLPPSGPGAALGQSRPRGAESDRRISRHRSSVLEIRHPSYDSRGARRLRSVSGSARLHARHQD